MNKPGPIVLPVKYISLFFFCIDSTRDPRSFYQEGNLQNIWWEKLAAIQTGWLKMNDESTFYAILFQVKLYLT